MATDPVEGIASIIAGQMADLHTSVAQATGGQVLPYSTMHDGQITVSETVPLLDENDDPVLDDENLSVVEERQSFGIGVQADGSVTITHQTGVEPFTPTPPVVTPGATSMNVTWDGMFMDDEDTPDVDESKVPMDDFARVEVHGGSTDSPQELDLDRDSLTRWGTIETRAGGSVALAAPAGTYWVALVAANKAGEYGEPSFAATVEVAAPGLTDDDKEQLATVLASADGKTTVTHSTSPASPANPGRTIGDTWFQHDDSFATIVAQWSWDGSAWTEAKVDSMNIANLDVGKLTTGMLAAGVRIIAGDQDGSHAEMSPAGFVTYRMPPSDAEDQNPFPSVILGQTAKSDSIQLRDADGAVLAGMDDTGKVSGSALDIDGADTNGDGQADSGASIYGRDFSEWLDDRSLGVVASAIFAATWEPPPLSVAASEVGVGELSFQQWAGRAYSVHCSGLGGIASATPLHVVTRLRYTVDGSAPTINSPILDATGRSIGIANTWTSTGSLDGYGTFGGYGDSIVRLLLTVQAYSSATATWTTQCRGDALAKPIRIWVRDEGRDVTDTWLYNEGGGTYTTATPPKPAPPVRRTYVTTWRSNGGATFDQAGRRIDKAGKFQQGYYSSANGNTKALAFFSGSNSTGSEPGRTISKALAGASIRKVEVFLSATNWYYGSGGTGVLGMWASNVTTTPTTYSAWPRAQVQSPGWPAGVGRWVTLPADAAAALMAGSRAVTIGPAPSTDRRYYGAFAGTLLRNPPLLRVTYVK